MGKQENFWGEWIKADDMKRVKMMSALPLVRALPKDIRGDTADVVNNYFNDLYIYMRQLLMYDTTDEQELREKIRTELTRELEADADKVVKISEKNGYNHALRLLKKMGVQIKDKPMRSKLAELIMELEADDNRP
jgi:leucyl aminopeptidase (aminopeptidase T)